MATKFQVVFDCADPARVAAFWEQALHYIRLGEYWVRMNDPEGNEFCVQ